MSLSSLKNHWIKYWMKLAGPGPFGRLATRLATLAAPRFFKRLWLADLNPRGYIAPSAEIDHSDLRLGKNIFVGERVKIIQDWDGGAVEIGDRAVLHWDIIVQTGKAGSISIGKRSSMQRGCQLIAYRNAIKIGNDVHIGPNCSFFPYNHGFEIGKLIVEQPLTSRGDIVLGDDITLGCGVIVLDGVVIGNGAVVGAGSVVAKDIPPMAIAAGVPARVLRMRADPVGTHDEMVIEALPKVVNFDSTESVLIESQTNKT